MPPWADATSTRKPRAGPGSVDCPPSLSTLVSSLRICTINEHARRHDIRTERGFLPGHCVYPPALEGINMGLINGLWLAVLGILGAASLIVAK